MGDDLLGEHDRHGRKTLTGNLYVKVNKFQVRYFNDWTIVKSDEMKASLKNVMKCSVIPNGINFKLFQPIDRTEARKALGINHEKKLILFPADPSRSEKNFSLVKNAMQILHGKYPGARILPVYEVDQVRLNLHYNAADVTVLSSYHEGSPNTIKEAMACNCPIVSTNVGDVKILTDGVDGCFISSFDASVFARNIERAFEFSHRTQGRKHIQHLGEDDIATQIITVYRKFMNS
jgi:glycosyltransferase involved in cell wall biosynthesis